MNRAEHPQCNIATSELTFAASRLCVLKGKKRFLLGELDVLCRTILFAAKCHGRDKGKARIEGQVGNKQREWAGPKIGGCQPLQPAYYMEYNTQNICKGKWGEEEVTRVGKDGCRYGLQGDEKLIYLSKSWCNKHTTVGCVTANSQARFVQTMNIDCLRCQLHHH